MTSPNITRDELNAQRLDTLAWTVITVWECELSKKNLDATIVRRQDQIRAVLCDVLGKSVYFGCAF